MIVLDTHAWYWWVTEATRLPRNVQRRLEHETELGIPAISLFEFAGLVRSGRLEIGDTMAFFDQVLSVQGVRLLPITPSIAVRASGLLGLNDPADRLIAATALDFPAPLVTRDDRMRAFPGLETLWD